MRKQVGASAGFLALLAVLLHSQLGPEPGRSSRGSPGNQVSVSGESTKREAASKGNTQGEKNQPAEDTVEGPWLAIRKFFGTESSLNGLEALGAQAGPSNASATISPAALLWPKKANSDLLNLRKHLGVPEEDKQSYPVVIATIADPVHTHLALYTDHEIEGILTGLQSAKWEFANQWLPWSDSFVAEKDDVSGRRKSRALLREQENIPGILIFRRAVPGPCSLALDPKIRLETGTPWPVFCADTLFVLVVPETPTAGINATSFNAAMRIATALRGDEMTKTYIGEIPPQLHQIGLLAPSFSGSFFSLARLINDWKRSPISNAPEALLNCVFTGTAAAFGYARAFENTTGFKLLGASASSLDYNSAFAGLLVRYGLTSRDVASLSEDETAWGGGSILPDGFVGNRPEREDQERLYTFNQIHTYRYPRDMSHLRNAYREEADNSGDPAQQLASRVLLSYEDPSAGEDAVPVFDNSRTPVSQLAVVESILKDIRDRRIRLVKLTATNPLDLLFLTRVIRKEAPDTRVLVQTSDILFLAAAARDALSGTLMLSSYPISLGGQDWKHVIGELPYSMPGREWRTFTSPNTEGVYWAVRELASALNISDPNNPSPPEFRPALWLLQLTRDGFWPLQVFPEANKYSAGQKVTWFSEPRDASYPMRTLVKDPDLPLDRPLMLRFPLDWKLVTFFTVAFTIFFLVFVFWNNYKLNKGLLWQFTLIENIVDLSGWCIAMLCGAMLALESAVWVLLFPSYHLAEESFWSPLQITSLGLCVVTAAGVLIVVVFLSWGVLQRIDPSHRHALLVPSLVIALFVVVFFVFAFCWSTVCSGSEWQSAFFCLRAIALFSGASPALPLLLFVLASFIGFATRFRMLTEASSSAKPKLCFGAYNIVPLAESYSSFESVWSNPAISLKGNTGKLFSLIVLTAVPLLVSAGVPSPAPGYYLFHWFDAFEPSRFNLLIALGLSSLFIFLILDCVRLEKAWQHFSLFLAMVGSLPLQRALVRTTRAWPKRLAWSPPPNSVLGLSAQQTIEAIHDWSVVDESANGKQRYSKIRNTFRRMARAQTLNSKVRFLRGSELVFQRRCADAFSYILVYQLWPFWRAHVRDDDSRAKSRAIPTIEGEANDRSLIKFASGAPTSEVSYEISRKLFPEQDRPPSARSRAVGLLGSDGEARSVIRFASSSPTIEKSRETSETVLTEEQKEKRIVSYGADVVALHLAAYIVYAARQVHRAARMLYVGVLFLILTLLSYHPQSPRLAARVVACFFVVIAFSVFRVLAGMERDKVLSLISKTKPGELNLEFWMKVIAFGGIPLLGVISHLFPEVSSFLFHWVSPGLKAME